MSIDEWARKVAADIALVTEERAPADAAILAHLDEFEDVARRTRLKIPAFARALTRAGLTLRSGKPYSAATLRSQIHRARARRERAIPAEASGSRSPHTTEPKPDILDNVASSAPAAATRASSEITPKPPVSLSMLEKVRQSRPIRPKLGSSED